MEHGFTVVLDAPGDAKQRLQIAQLGDYNDKRYGGDFSITRDDVEQWRSNLAHLPGKRALIDLDHRADRTPRNTEAAGWITDIGWDGNTPVADVEWTPVGEKAIAEKRYLFFSPTYGPHRTEDGAVHENTLVGGALTNRPFLSGMPAITLASEETLQAAADDDPLIASSLTLLDALTAKQRDNLNASDFAIPEDRSYPLHDLSHARNALARSSGKPEEAQVKAAVYKRYPQLKPPPAGSDTRRAMDADLLKALDLDETADTQKALETIADLKAKADKPATPEPTKTLEAQAADAGKRLLDADEFRKLEQKADAGDAAMKQLHTQRFEAAFDKALTHPDGAKVKPAEKERLQHFYELDADATLQLLDEREPLVQARPSGWQNTSTPEDDTDARELVARGVHPGAHQLDLQVKAKLKELGKGMDDYATVLTQIMADERAAV